MLKFDLSTALQFLCLMLDSTNNIVADALREWKTVRQSIDLRLGAMIRNEQFLCDVLNGARNTGVLTLPLPSVRRVENTLQMHYGQVSCNIGSIVSLCR